jgi:glucokinase
MHNKTILGIDLGGTHVRGGLVQGKRLSALQSHRMHTQGSPEEVLEHLFSFTDPLIDKSVSAIGIGVPGLVDVSEGMVYDVVNIPSWKKVPLQHYFEERYQVPVLVNNDANCFALGEFCFGKGIGVDSMIGLTIGTGLGSGIILNNKLYDGKHGGAGEFGMIQYLEHNYEYYASGLFFQNVYGVQGETVFMKAQEGDPDYLKMYAEMGSHLGNAIVTILYALDVELIVLGGSVRKAWPYFNASMWERVKTFAYQRTREKIRIEVSTLENSGVLGAASLFHGL